MEVINKTVNLSDIEMEFCMARAEARREKKPRDPKIIWGEGNTLEEKHRNQSLLGIIGEYAASKVLGGDMDWKDYGYFGDGNEGDLMIGGVPHAVKATRYWPPYVRITSEKEIAKADKIVLCYVSVPKKTAIVAGVLTTEEFWAHCYIDDFGQGKRYCFEFEGL